MNTPVNGAGTRSPGQQADIIATSSLWDNMDIIREQVLVNTLQFDDVLDPDLLRDSLIKLISRDGWIKLGGRLRLNVSVLFLYSRAPIRMLCSWL